MRPLTSAEARVVQVLLDPRPASERDRMAQAGLPTRTFETAARRLLEAGVVYDRYLPNPSTFGVPGVSFGLVRPFAETAETVRARWLASPGNVLVWRAPEWLFGVFFGTGAVPATRLVARLAHPNEVSWSCFVAVDSRAPQVPIYFDFEGAWAVLCGTAPSERYPRPLPGAGQVTPGPPGTRPGASDERSGSALTRRAVASPGEAGEPRRRSLRFLSRPERQALRRGAVEHRVLLDVAHFPQPPAGVAEQLVWIVARLRDRRTPEACFAALRGRGRLSPFLFATDERRVLVAAISGARPPAGTARPSPPRDDPGGILQEYLEQIEVVRTPMSGVVVERDHRYERLFADDRPTTADA